MLLVIWDMRGDSTTTEEKRHILLSYASQLPSRKGHEVFSFLKVFWWNSVSILGQVISHFMFPRGFLSALTIPSTVFHSPSQSGYSRCIHHDKITANVQAKKARACIPKNKTNFLQSNRFLEGWLFTKYLAMWLAYCLLRLKKFNSSYKINVFLVYLNFTTAGGKKYSLLNDQSSLKEPFLLLQ